MSAKDQWWDDTDSEGEDDPIPSSKAGQKNKARGAAPAVAVAVAAAAAAAAPNPNEIRPPPVQPKPIPADPDRSARNQPITGTKILNHKQKCKLAHVGPPVGSGADACRAGRPAELTLDRIKLHSVIHYRMRGTWDKIVNPPAEDGTCGIESYECGVCKKRYKNFPDKREFPGFGCITCHLAVEHGLLYRAMKEDPDVDMAEVIDILCQVDDRFANQVKEGLEYLPPDDKLVIEREAFMWKHRQAELAGKPMEAPARPVWVKPQIFKCPHCNEMDANKNGRSALRLHIYKHYEDYWKPQLEAIKGSGYSTELQCVICQPKKRISGATVEGCRNSFICHLAIQHKQLRVALEGDKSGKIDAAFIEDLYSEDSAANNKPQFPSAPPGMPVQQPISRPPPAPTPPPPAPPVVKPDPAKKPAPGPASKTKPGPASTKPGPASKKPANGRPGPASKKKAVSDEDEEMQESESENSEALSLSGEEDETNDKNKLNGSFAKKRKSGLSLSDLENGDSDGDEDYKDKSGKKRVAKGGAPSSSAAAAGQRAKRAAAKNAGRKMAQDGSDNED